MVLTQVERYLPKVSSAAALFISYPLLLSVKYKVRDLAGRPANSVIAVSFTIPEVQIRIGTGGGLRASLLALPCLRTSQRIKAERASQTLFAS